MGKTFEEIGAPLQEWIGRQQLFFVGTAPLDAEGHINMSPKGLDTFRILGPRRVAYLDLTGSGAETMAHVRENGRIVVMFCAFEGPPRIVRLHGKARAHTPGTPDWGQLKPLFPTIPGARAIFDIAVGRISDSCGFGIPVYSQVQPRDTLERWALAKGPEGLDDYRNKKNRRSIDGLESFEG